MWTAPEPGSGCVTFHATVIEHRDVWYMDDGPLTKDFCEDEDATEGFITNILEYCGACHEAKYEVCHDSKIGKINRKSKICLFASISIMHSVSLLLSGVSAVHGL